MVHNLGQIISMPCCCHRSNFRVAQIPEWKICFLLFVALPLQYPYSFYLFAQNEMSLRLCLVSAYFIWSCCTSSIISLQWHQASAALLELSHTERTDSLPPVFSKEFFVSFHWELCRKLSRTFIYSAETFNYKFLVGFQLLYCIIQWQSKRTWCPCALPLTQNHFEYLN